MVWWLLLTYYFCKPCLRLWCKHFLCILCKSENLLISKMKWKKITCNFHSQETLPSKSTLTNMKCKSNHQLMQSINNCMIRSMYWCKCNYQNCLLIKTGSVSNIMIAIEGVAYVVALLPTRNLAKRSYNKNSRKD